jgi:hypothetical protein
MARLTDESRIILFKEMTHNFARECHNRDSLAAVVD